jgi:hypothetical protein
MNTHTEPKKLSRVQAMTSKGKTLIASGKAIKTQPTKPTTMAPTKQASIKAANAHSEPGVMEAMKKAKRKLTMSADARNQIRDGITRTDLRVHLAKEWKLAKEKEWYTNWYFADAKRRGIKTCECSAK